MSPTQAEPVQITGDVASSVLTEVLFQLVGDAEHDLVDQARELLRKLGESHWDRWYGRAFAVSSVLGSADADPRLLSGIVGVVSGLARVCEEGELRRAVYNVARDDHVWRALRGARQVATAQTPTNACKR